MTTVALDDLQPADRTAQRRHMGSQHDNTSPEPAERRDTIRATLSQNTPSFQPTNVYWFSPHGLLPTNDLEIFDLSTDISTPFTGFTDAYQDEVDRARKDHASTPLFTVHRDNLMGTKYTIRHGQGEIIAHWQHPWISSGEVIFSFPHNSPHCSHPIHLAPEKLLKSFFGGRSETFAYNSAKFVWNMDSKWHQHKMTLYKVWGSGDAQRRVEVGRFNQKWGLLKGGIFVVDEREVGGLVACLTVLAVLKKKRQREGGGG